MDASRFKQRKNGIRRWNRTVTFEEVFDNKYETIAPLREDRGIWLLMEKETKKIRVGKMLRVYDREVYKQLLQTRSVHLVQVLEIFEQKEEKILYEVEAYVGGETLEEKIRRDGPIQKERAELWMMALCEALNVLHRQKPPVIHRDLKLSNVMITDDGILKVIDFNAARNYEEGMDQDTRLIGTNGYAAPEQYGFAQSDARTDLYAAGVIFNYLLTGKPLGEQKVEGQLGEIIKKCVQIDPENRYQSAEELRLEIRTYLHQSIGTPKVSGRWIHNLWIPIPKWNIQAWRELHNEFWPIPGFRGKNLFVKIGAGIGYLLLTVISANISDGSGWIIDLVNKVGFFVMCLVMIAICCDYGKISRHLPFLGSRRFFTRLFGKFLFCFLDMLAIVFLIYLAEGIFK